MSSLKRVLALGGLTALLGALAFAVPAAQATGGGVDGACVVVGAAKTDPPVAPVGGGGGFTFTSLELVCVGIEKSAPVVTMQSAGATGTYTNIVCGTGKAIGTVTGLTGKYLPFNKKFAVEFVGTVGVFYWHQSALPLPNLKPLPGDNGLKRWKPAGVVDLLPPAVISTKGLSTPSLTVCTKAFDIIGVVLVTNPKVP